MVLVESGVDAVLDDPGVAVELVVIEVAAVAGAELFVGPAAIDKGFATLEAVWLVCFFEFVAHCREFSTPKDCKAQ